MARAMGSCGNWKLFGKVFQAPARDLPCHVSFHARSFQAQFVATRWEYSILIGQSINGSSLTLPQEALLLSAIMII